MRFFFAPIVVVAFASPAAPALAAAPAPMEQLAPGAFLLPGNDIGELYVDGNSGAVLTEDGWLLYDTGARPSRALALLTALKTRSRAPVKYAVNSEWHPDHCFGNAAVKAAFPNVSIVSTAFTRATMAATAGSMKNALSGAVDRKIEAAAAEKKPYPTMEVEEAFIAEFVKTEIVLPTLAYAGEMSLHFGSREFRFLSLDGDAAGISALYLPAEKILFAGDVVVYPTPYTPNSFAIGAWRESLERVAAMDVALIVPGHGPAMRDKVYVGLLIDLLESVDAQVRAALAKGARTADLEKSVDLLALKSRFIAADPSNADAFDGFASGLILKAAQEARDGAQFTRG
jgi:glyoxylase-like metal-dependent hydrolase (beta-lactamase superfamily II)